MNKSITLKVFSDPGHGWARFPRSRLVKLNIADRISHFSYQRGANVFLEEDCDLSTLTTALKERGYDIKFDQSHTNRSSKIRSYNSYRN